MLFRSGWMCECARGTFHSVRSSSRVAHWTSCVYAERDCKPENVRPKIAQRCCSKSDCQGWVVQELFLTRELELFSQRTGIIRLRCASQITGVEDKNSFPGNNWRRHFSRENRFSGNVSRKWYSQNPESFNTTNCEEKTSVVGRSCSLTQIRFFRQHLLEIKPMENFRSVVHLMMLEQLQLEVHCKAPRVRILWWLLFGSRMSPRLFQLEVNRSHASHRKNVCMHAKATRYHINLPQPKNNLEFELKQNTFCVDFLPTSQKDSSAWEVIFFWRTGFTTYFPTHSFFKDSKKRNQRKILSVYPTDRRGIDWKLTSQRELSPIKCGKSVQFRDSLNYSRRISD